MKNSNNSFVIKVSDILHNLGTKDTISFVNKFSTFLPQLSEEGLSCKVILQSLSDEQLLVKIPKVTVPLTYECDYCGEVFTTTMYIKKLETKAVKESLLDENKGFEISIDEKNYIIYIEKWLAEAIIIKLPVNNMCTNCKNKPIDQEDDFAEKTSIIWKKA